MSLTEYQVKCELNQLLPSPLSDRQWAYLKDNGYIDEARNPDEPLTTRDLVAVVRELRESWGESKALKPLETLKLAQQSDISNTTDVHELRRQVLSLLVADEAERDEEVQRYRTQVLNGQLLQWEQIEGWIEQTARTEGDLVPTWWLKGIPLSSAAVRAEEVDLNHLEVSGMADQIAFDVRVLEYGVPDDDRIYQVPTVAGGKLEWLRQVSESLSARYFWQEAGATIFVLTDGAPLINSLTDRVQDRTFQALSRIVLTIDPALSPKEVTDYYRAVRQRVVGARHRELDPKHHALALMVSIQADGETWENLVIQWNVQHPEWQYAGVAKFKYECLKARRMLLRPAE